MHLKSFIKGINGIIPGGISIKDFSMVAETDQSSAKKILEELIKNNIGKKENGMFNFSPGDRLKAALYALKEGASIDDVSENKCADPPGCVGGELDVAVGIKPLDGLHEADVPLLDEVQEVHVDRLVLHRDLDHESEICGDERVGRVEISMFVIPDGKSPFFLAAEWLGTADVSKVALQCVPGDEHSLVR